MIREVLLVSLLLVAVSAQECPAKNIITVAGGGRTGNCIWEYFALYFASKTLANGQIPYSQRYINDFLTPIFDNVSLPIVEDIPKNCACCPNVNWTQHNTDITLFQPYKNATERTKNVTGNIILSKCVVLVEPMAPNIEEIKRVLPYKKHLLRKAEKKLEKIAKDYYSKTGIENITFVAVHVRRTDYLPLLETAQKEIPTPMYYQKSMLFFRDRSETLGTPVFVLTTDDPEWANKHLSAPDVYVCSKKNVTNPGKDLALLSLCDHAIIDYGTFGYWIGLQTEGNVLTIYEGKTQLYKYLKKNPKWHFVNTTTMSILLP